MSDISSLPTENRIYILSYLNIKSVLQCRKVSKQWCREASTNYIWAKFLEGNERAQFKNLSSFKSDCFDFLVKNYTLRLLKSFTPLGMKLVPIFNLEKIIRVIKGSGIFYFIKKTSMIKFCLSDLSSKELGMSSSLSKVDFKSLKLMLNMRQNLIFASENRFCEIIDENQLWGEQTIFTHETIITCFAASDSSESYLIVSENSFDKKNHCELRVLQKSSENEWVVSLCEKKWESGSIEGIRMNSMYFFVVSNENKMDSASFFRLDSSYIRTCCIFNVADCSVHSILSLDKSFIHFSSSWKHICYAENSEKMAFCSKNGIMNYFSNCLSDNLVQYDFKSLIKDVEYDSHHIFLLGNEYSGSSLIFFDTSCMSEKKISIYQNNLSGLSFFEGQLYFFDQNFVYKGEPHKMVLLVQKNSLWDFFKRKL